MQMLGKFKLVYRRSSLAVKCIVLGAIICCTATLVVLGIFIGRENAKTAAATQQAAELEQENARKEQNVNQLGTPESDDRIAREEAGLVDPDTVIIDITD